MVQFSFSDGRKAKLRSTALGSMLLALEVLDGLGDELPAAATLQHAIDRLSYDQRCFGEIIVLNSQVQN
ncbi:MAG: hypothetical protein AABY88_10125 [Pseudomonadota bacterium]